MLNRFAYLTYPGSFTISGASMTWYETQRFGSSVNFSLTEMYDHCGLSLPENRSFRQNKGFRPPENPVYLMLSAQLKHIHSRMLAAREEPSCL